MNTILNPASNSGIRSATVTLLPPLAVVVHNPSLISKEQLVSEISDGGYGAEIVSSSLVTTTDASTTNERTVKLRIDGFFCSCVLPSFLPGFPSLTPTPQQLLNRRQRPPLLLRFHRLAPLLHASLPRRSHHDPYLHPLPDLHPPHPPPPHHLSRPLHPHPSTHLLRPLRSTHPHRHGRARRCASFSRPRRQVRAGGIDDERARQVCVAGPAFGIAGAEVPGRGQGGAAEGGS